MSPPDAAGALAALPSIPRDATGPVFPAPWAATAFAMTLALHQRGLFTWPEWAECLGAAIAASDEAEPTGPEDYWRCWLAALETMIVRCGLAAGNDLAQLQTAWRAAAEATPHGEPVTLSDQVSSAISR